MDTADATLTFAVVVVATVSMIVSTTADEVTRSNSIQDCSYMKTGSTNSVIPREVVRLTQQRQREVLLTKLIECLCQMETDPYTLGGPHCNRTWDNVMCWPDTPAGTTARQPCPAYINNFKTYQLATRTCLPNATWYVHPALHNTSGAKGWTNYSACGINNTHQERTKGLRGVPVLMLKHLSEFRMMYNIGYALSLVSLVFAVTIMVYFRRLHCPRNVIHLNLFVSFMLRAAISLVRDNLMVAGLGFPSDIGYNGSDVIYFRDGSHWGCRTFFTVFQYAVGASYVWIFMEGVYLHMYIFVSIFVEKTSVHWYIAIGWALPFVIVIPWAVSRILLDNTVCWNTHNNYPALMWIIKGPIMVTIVLNLLFFINIVRVLFTKLSTTPTLEAKRCRYRRLARSTLFLIPLFGVYYIVFTLPLETMDDTVEFVMIFIEMFFNSYQGFVIAVVLCFINSEVRTEIHRAWKLHFETGRSYPKTNYATRRSSIEQDQQEPDCAGTTLPATNTKQVRDSNKNVTFELQSPKNLTTIRSKNIHQNRKAHAESLPSYYQNASTESSELSTNYQNDACETQNRDSLDITSSLIDNADGRNEKEHRYTDYKEKSVSYKRQDNGVRRNLLDTSKPYSERTTELEEGRYLLAGVNENNTVYIEK